MMFCEEGCFQLADSIAKFRSESGEMVVWDGIDSSKMGIISAEVPITVRHLLTHASGMIYGFMNFTPVHQYYRE